MKKILLLFIIIFSGISEAGAQVSFQAIPQKKEAGLNEPVAVRFILTIKNKQVKGVSAIKLPIFSNAQVVGRQVVQNQSYDEEGVIIEYGEEIGLQAVKAGHIKVGAASIMVDGKEYTTKPLTITINNTEPQEQEGKVSSSRMGDAFLTFKISDKNPYQNEGVVGKLKFYTRRIDLLNTMTNLEAPNFNGLYVQMIKERNNTYEQEVINGEIYYSRTIGSYVLFSSKPGQVTINPFTLTFVISNNFFDDREVYVSSAPVVLQVKKIPENAPNDFYGVVGDYTMKIIPNKRNLKEEETATVQVEVSGKGNINLVKVPELIVPKGVEQFTPKNKLESVPGHDGLQGRTSTSTVLVPHHGGKFTIKVKPFSYFDPNEGKFKKLTAGPVVLQVAGDSVVSKKDTIDNKLPDDSGKIESYIPDIKVKEVITDVLDIKKEKSNSGWLILASAVGLVVLGVIGFIFIRRKKTKQEEVSETEEKTKFEKLQEISGKPQKQNFETELFRLKKIVERGGSKEEFYPLLESILQKAIYQNLGIHGNQYVDSVEIEEKLTNKFGDEFSDDCKNLLLKSQIERYSNLSDEVSLQFVYTKAEELIKRLT